MYYNWGTPTLGKSPVTGVTVLHTHTTITFIYWRAIPNVMIFGGDILGLELSNKDGTLMSSISSAF